MVIARVVRKYWRLVVILLCTVAIVGQVPVAAALSADQKHLFDVGIYYYDESVCGNSDSSSQSSSGGTKDLTYKDTSRGGRTVGATLYSAGDGQPHPLIVFAPGRNQDSKDGDFYSRYLKAIAAQGFTVAGANFSDNTSYGAIPNEVDDINFLIKQLESDSSVASSINVTNGVGLVGHSDGGIVAYQVAYSAKQAIGNHISAVIAADGALAGGDDVQGPPLLIMHGTNDTIENISSSVNAYNTINAPYKAFAKFVGADHHSYITGGKSVQDGKDYSSFNPAVDALTGAFLKRELGVQVDDSTKLSTVVANYSSEIQFSEQGTDPAGAGAGAGNATSSTQSNDQTQCCASGGDGGGATILPTGQNPKSAFDYFLGKGLTPPQAAGIVGNLMQESGVNPKANNGTHIGIAQWDSGRWGALQQFAQQKGADPYNLGLQLDYLWSEVQNGGEQDSLAKLKQTNTAADAATSWEATYERSGKDHLDKRIGYANGALAQYGSDNPSSSNIASSGGGSCGGGGSGQLVGGLSWPMDKSLYDKNPSNWLQLHHDGQPFDDIPEPPGTPVYAMLAGSIVSAPAGGGCGQGVIIDSKINGEQIRTTYCHGLDGGQVKGAEQGAQVTAGQLIMHVGSTGDSTGPHLHLQLNIDGTFHCVQDLFVDMSHNSVPGDLKTLPTGVCGPRTP